MSPSATVVTVLPSTRQYRNTPNNRACALSTVVSVSTTNTWLIGGTAGCRFLVFLLFVLARTAHARTAT